MMRKFLLTAISLSLVALSAGPAIAQVDARVIGSWNMAVGGGAPPRMLRIDGNGHYEWTASGQVIDSGSITFSNGQWKKQSNSGRSEKGDYGVIGGKLQFYSGNLMGIYSKSSGAPQYSPPSGQTSQYTESGIEIRSVRPGATLPYTWRRKLGKLSGQPQAESNSAAATSGASSTAGVSPSPQRIPRGGYIPVMKDNKARQYYNGF